MPDKKPSTNKDSGEKKEFAHNEDVTFEEEEEGSAASIKKIREKLKVCLEEKQEYLLGWQRAKADFINQKKEHEAAQGRFIKFAKENFLHDLLPILDSFHLAFGKKETWEKVEKSWRVGVEQIYTQLISVLKENGAEEIPVSIGESFNPVLHASVASVETPNEAEYNTVLEIIQKGYTIHGKVLRPASVKVGVPRASESIKK